MVIKAGSGRASPTCSFYFVSTLIQRYFPLLFIYHHHSTRDHVTLVNAAWVRSPFEALPSFKHDEIHKRTISILFKTCVLTDIYLYILEYWLRYVQYVPTLKISNRFSDFCWCSTILAEVPGDQLLEELRGSRSLITKVQNTSILSFCVAIS